MRCIFLALLVTSLSVHAGANCDAIITHGLRNIEVSESSDVATSTRYFNHCQKTFSLLTDNQLAEAEVEVFGYGSGSGGYSRQTREERLNQWCTTNKEAALRNQQRSASSQSFYQGAVAAWEACNALGQNSIVVQPVITPDARLVDIGIVYKGNTKSGIDLTGIATDGFTCTTLDPATAQSVKFPIEVKNLTIQAHCVREQPKLITREGQNFSVLPRGTISVHSSAEPFQLFFAEEWNPEMPAKAQELLRSEIVQTDVPVGTVVASTLPPQVFLSSVHPQGKSGSWMLADGSLLPAGSSYGKLANATSVPDLKDLTTALTLLSARTGVLNDGQNIKELEALANVGSGATWTWFSATRETVGWPSSGNWEQDTHHFQSVIDDKGVVWEHTRTMDRKGAGRWHDWIGGQANLIGLATKTHPFYYYIKIN